MGDSPDRLGGISLRQLLPDAQFVGAADVRVTGCTSDSRSCRAGDLFVALRGVLCDGHAFAQEAVARGASALIVERPVTHVDCPQCVVADSREAYGQLCQALAGDPSQAIRVIGVTGTNGKTTTSHLIASILEAAHYSPGLMGTLGYFDGMSLEPARLTTPAAPTLATWLARMRVHGCTHAVVEVSSHALAQRRPVGVQFDTACVTNVRHDHLDFHGAWECYRDAKGMLLDQLGPEGLTVLNADDAGSMSLISRAHGPVLTVGIDQPAEIRATIIEQGISQQMFLLEVDHATAPVETTLIGQHNISNCLIAAAVGFGQGIDLETIVRGLEAVKKIPGRLDRVECGQPFGVFVDYAHTADALAGVLSTLRPLTRGRLICVFGAGGDRDRTKRPGMGRVVEQLADLAMVTTDNPRTEDPAQIAADILTGFRASRDAHVVLDRTEAIGRAILLARPGDCVLIAGRGHETLQVCENSCLELDDRQVAEEWLYGLDHTTGLLRRAA